MGRYLSKENIFIQNKREELLLLFKCLVDFIKFVIGFVRNVSSTYQSDNMRHEKRKKFQLETKAVTAIPICLCQQPNDLDTDLEKTLHDTEGSPW